MTDLAIIWDENYPQPSERIYFFGPGTHSLYANRWGVNGAISVNFNGIEYNIVSQ